MELYFVQKGLLIFLVEELLALIEDYLGEVGELSGLDVLEDFLIVALVITISLHHETKSGKLPLALMLHFNIGQNLQNIIVLLNILLLSQVLNLSELTFLSC